MRLLATASIVALSIVSSDAGRAEPAPPDAASLLFEEPQLAATRPGDVLTYLYSRKSAESVRFGPSFDDRIRLIIDQGTSGESRNVEVELFSGERRRPAGPFHDMVGNPLLSLVLEDHIESLAARFGANPRYFKTAIRTAFRDKASIVADRIDVGGHPEPGWRVTIMPFKDDPHKAIMSGFEALTYEFKVVKTVPGEIAGIRISAPDGQNGTLLEENVDYVAKAN